MVEKYRKDPTIPLVDVVQNFQIYSGEKPSNQVGLAPSKGELLSNFGSDNMDECIKKMLLEGEIIG